MLLRCGAVLPSIENGSCGPADADASILDTVVPCRCDAGLQFPSGSPNTSVRCELRGGGADWSEPAYSACEGISRGAAT